jgi:hypothetical protein
MMIVNSRTDAGPAHLIASAHKIRDRRDERFWLIERRAASND